LKKTSIDKYILAFSYITLLILNGSVLAANNKLKVSVPSFAPFNVFTEDIECAGASVIALEEVTKDLDVELELISYPYARILHSLKSAHLDVALIFKNSGVSKEAYYIGPVSYSEIVVISHPRKTINKYDDLHKLKNIAVIRNAQFDEKFDKDNSLNKVSVDSYRQAINMLKYQRVDAVIGSLIGIEYALRQEKMNNNILLKAFHLSKKEWGLHLSKKSKYTKLRPLLTDAVKQTYQEDLIYQLYQQQIQNCLSL
jgi:polar amino acid transport system substrate-binding protein